MNENQTHKRHISDLQSVLKTAAGRRVLWRILQSTQLHAHGFVPNDALSTAFHCGQRSIGLFLLGALDEASPSSYQQMRMEYLSETKSLQQQINRAQEELSA